MMRSFHHTGISVPDLEEALRFYCDVLGFEEAMRDDWADSKTDDEIMNLADSAGSYALVRLGDTFLELLQFNAPKPLPLDATRRVSDHGLTHLCFLVDDIQGEYERLPKHGVSFLSPPMWNSGEPGVSDGWCCYGHDPFDNVVELLQYAFAGGPIPQESAG